MNHPGSQVLRRGRRTDTLCGAEAEKVRMTDHTGEMPPSAGSGQNGGYEAFSVLVPAYNEEEGILDTLTDLQDRLAALAEKSEIIVIDDGSTDRTRALLEGRPGIRVVHHDRNRGYGAALKTGIRHARHQLVVITDADGTYPSERIFPSGS